MVGCIVVVGCKLVPPWKWNYHHDHVIEIRPFRFGRQKRNRLRLLGTRALLCGALITQFSVGPKALE